MGGSPQCLAFRRLQFGITFLPFLVQSSEALLKMNGPNGSNSIL